MNRRDFLKVAAAAAAFPALSSCAVAPVRPDGSPEPVPVDDFLKQGPRVMWVAPHPDDECFPGPLLARSSIYYGNPLAMIVLTHGEGGECYLKTGCSPDVGTVRGMELEKVADMYRAVLVHEHFFNAPLPVSSFPKRHELFGIWKKHKDPVRFVADAIRRLRPDLLVTFDPHNGATGHPEHQLTSRIATAAVRLAADEKTDLRGRKPHNVERTYYVLNRHWVFKLLFRADPGPVTETFDAELPCKYGMNCLDFMCQATLFHRTQYNDMHRVRSNRGAFAEMNLKQVDPFTQIEDPAEEA